MAPPLISEYKTSFVLKRLLTTFLGGLNLFSSPILIIIQILIFILPAILIILVNLDDESDLKLRSVVTGCTIFLADFSLALIIFLLKRGRNVAQIVPSVRVSDTDGESGGVGLGVAQEHITSFLSQEDRVPNEGCHKPSTWIFIAPNVALSVQYVLALILSSSSFGFCAPLMISEKISPFLRTFAIFSMCNARYSTVISAPPEISIFDTTFPEKKNILYRAFYTGGIGLAYIIFAQFSQDPDEHCVITFLCTILAILPILWGCGSVPPIKALLPWGLGVILLLLGGSSPSFHYAGTLISILIVVICPILVFVISQESLKIVLAECVAGYIISCDTGRVIALKPGLCEDTPTKAFLRRLLFPSLNIITSLICIALTWSNVEQVDRFGCKVALASTTLTISLLSCIFRYFTMSSKEIKNFILIPVHIIYGMITFLLHIWLTLSIEHEQIEWSSVKESVSHSLLRLVPYILAIRGFSLAVTEPRKSSLDFSLAFFIQRHLEESKSSFVLILFICSLITSRIKKLFRHWKTICSIWYAFSISTIMDNKKVKIMITAAALIPVSLVSLMIVIIFEGMTLIPIFTLPIFLIGFPRPTTFWSEKWLMEKSKRKGALHHVEVETIDRKIYSEIGTLLACAISRKAHNAKLSLERGDCFLARYEDRLLFVRIISTGWNYAYFQIKGLEMQEQTSCHHQEAAKIDEIFDAVLSNSRTKCFKIALDFLSLLMLSPMCTLKLPTYSESKSNISSLSTPEEKSTFRDMFYRAFSYLWIKNNPALKGESYQKGLSKPLGMGAIRSKSIITDDLPTIDASEELPKHEEFSVKNSLLKLTKPTFNFLKNLGNKNTPSSPIVIPPQGPSPSWEEHASEDDKRRDSSSPEIEEIVPPPPTKRKFSIPKLTRQSTTTSIISLQNNHSHNGGRRCSVSSPTPARLVDVESGPFLQAAQKNNSSLEIEGSDRLSSVFVKQCVGDVIPSNAVRARVEKICNSVWDIAIGLDDEIDLSEFFQDDFLQKLKTLSTSQKVDLEQITLKALRYACKLTLDEIFTTNYSSSKVITVEGDIEEEIFTQLTLFEREYQFCSPHEIPHHLKQNANHIITMNKSDEHKTALMRILNYEVQGVEFKLGQLDQYTLEGIWANLNLELLYLTSDDDERFSIQNDRVLLRNIMTQTAKTPLGYPVYEALFRVNLHDFSVTQIE